MLGVDRDASEAEIRRAYLARARQFHPDVSRDDPQAAERMRRVNQAWELLSDPGFRVPSPARPAGAGSRAPAAAGPRPATDLDDADFDDPDPYAGFSEADDRAITPGGLPDWLRLTPPLTLVAGAVSGGGWGAGRAAAAGGGGVGGPGGGAGDVRGGPAGGPGPLQTGPRVSGPASLGGSVGFEAPSKRRCLRRFCPLGGLPDSWFRVSGAVSAGSVAWGACRIWGFE